MFIDEMLKEEITNESTDVAEEAQTASEYDLYTESEIMDAILENTMEWYNLREKMIKCEHFCIFTGDKVKLAKGIQEFTEEASSGVRKYVDMAKSAIASAFAKIKEMVQWVISKAKGLKDVTVSMGKGAIDAVVSAFQAAINAIVNAPDKAKQIIADFKDKVKGSEGESNKFSVSELIAKLKKILSLGGLFKKGESAMEKSAGSASSAPAEKAPLKEAEDMKEEKKDEGSAPPPPDEKKQSLFRKGIEKARAIGGLLTSILPYLKSLVSKVVTAIKGALGKKAGSEEGPKEEPKEAVKENAEVIEYPEGIKELIDECEAFLNDIAGEQEPVSEEAEKETEDKEPVSESTEEEKTVSEDADAKEAPEEKKTSVLDLF